MKASAFIERMFEGRTKGNVILCSYANDRTEGRKYPPREIATRDWAKVDKFLADYDEPGRAVYFTCSTMMARKRNKEEVAHINSLFVDLDFKGIVEDRKTIEAVLRELKLKPSVVVMSGNGLHCYWLLDKPAEAEHATSCEELMRRMSTGLAGDLATNEVSRVFRLPGSHNSKNGEWKEVAVIDSLSTWKTYSYAALDECFSALADNPRLTYQKTKKQIERESKPTNHYLEFARRGREMMGGFDIGTAIDEMSFHDTQGNGIDDTYTHVVGAMVRDEKTVEEVYEMLLGPTRRVYERDRGSKEGPWNERRAIRELTSKYNYFVRKDRKKERDAEREATTPATNTQADIRAAEKAKREIVAEKARKQAEREAEASAKTANAEARKSKAETLSKDDKGDKAKPKAKRQGVDYDFDPEPESSVKSGSGKSSGGKSDKPALHSDPHDFWKMVPTETIRPGMLPAIVENVAFEYAERTGLNRDALAMGMLTVISSVLDTEIKVAAYDEVDNTFIESLRIWTANVGVAGSGKSPVMKAIMAPIDEIDAKHREAFSRDMQAFKAMDKEEQKESEPPKRIRAKLPNDASTESAQVNFADNPQGLLAPYDELVTFFGAKSRYSNKSGGGEQTSRGFWLSAYDSSFFQSSRLSRADVDCTPSCSIVGGIQPSVLVNLVDDASRGNDGLVQRFNPVIMPDKMKKGNRDIDPKYPLTIYNKLIHDIYKNCPLRLTGATLHFSPKAEDVRDRMFDWVDNYVESELSRNEQLASHVNKFKGMFVRFCGIFHMTEHYMDKQPRLISAETAMKVYKFMTSFRLKHAECFYSQIIENEETTDMKNIADFILAHGLDSVSAREMQRGSTRLRRISTRDIAHTAGNMVALGWLYHVTGKRSDSHSWHVNEDVHTLFAARAKVVADRNAEDTKRLTIARAQAEADDIPPEKLN